MGRGLFKDLGTNSSESVDYPDFAHKLSESIEIKKNEIGIQFCGTGNGINMSANKHQGIRSALCWNTHIAEQSRLHNNANILTMPARHLKWEEVKRIVDSAYDRTKKLLLDKREQLEKIANKLLEKEILFQNDLEKLIGKRPFESKSIIEEDNKRENKNDNSSTKEE